MQASDPASTDGWRSWFRILIYVLLAAGVALGILAHSWLLISIGVIIAIAVYFGTTRRG